MSDHTRTLPQKILENDSLTAYSRVAVPVLLAALLGFVGWFGSGVVADVRTAKATGDIAIARVAVLESAGLQGRVDLDRRLSALEDHDKQDARTNIEIVGRLSTIEADQKGLLRALEKIETAVSLNGARR